MFDLLSGRRDHSRGSEELETLPPFLDEKISRLVTIPGESGDSGYNSGLDGKAKSREIFNDSRTNS